MPLQGCKNKIDNINAKVYKIVVITSIKNIKIRDTIDIKPIPINLPNLLSNTSLFINSVTIGA